MGADPGSEAWSAMRDLMMAQRGTMLAAASELDLSPPQLLALRALHPGEPAPMSALAQVLRCDASNVTGIVDRLEDRGLVQRRPAPHDRRVKHLVLTERGEELRRRAAAWLDAPPPGFEALSADEQRELRDLLRKVAGAAPRPA
ncbi:MAG: MarR family transcriptional regulator [Solirubrobacterales bacterium]|nr:MarR family transcriptional regulator [Solirubrobacterales bacterium]